MSTTKRLIRDLNSAHGGKTVFEIAPVVVGLRWFSCRILHELSRGVLFSKLVHVCSEPFQKAVIVAVLEIPKLGAKCFLSGGVKLC